MTKKTKLTEQEWRRVFELRCRLKRGESLSSEERALTDAAFAEDVDRYSAMEGAVFDATVPFGSSVRWRR